MRILAIDDEDISLKFLELKLKECVPEAACHFYNNAEEALDFLKQLTSDQHPDIVFLDIDIYPMNGLEIAKIVKLLCPTSSIVFLTGYSEYAVEAFSMKVSGYLLKPVSTEELKKEIDFARLQHAPTDFGGDDQLTVHCFGTFEVYSNNQNLHFKRTKSKELFAYLIDRRGSSVTMAEIASVLWPDGMFDRSRNNQIHTFLHDLSQSFEEQGLTDVIVKKRNAVAVNREKVSCDYYDFLNGKVTAINAYSGEYMTQYWWSEFTAGKIYAISEAE